MEPLVSAGPLVSIGLAVRNGGPALKDAIEAILAQDYPHFELIISDNASTDSTGQLCQWYAGSDNRIRYYRNASDIGAPANFNRVFALARGSYFMWAAHDDLRKPDFISACLAGFIGTTVLVGTGCSCVDREGRQFLIDWGMSTWGMTPAARFMRYKRALHDYNRHRGGIFYGLYRTAALARVMPMKSAMTADQNMMLELSLLGEFSTVQKVLLTRRMNGASRSFRSLARAYGLTNPIRIYGAYLFREWEIDKMLARSSLSRAHKVGLMAWSLGHTFTAVSKRLIELGCRRLKK